MTFVDETTADRDISEWRHFRRAKKRRVAFGRNNYLNNTYKRQSKNTIDIRLSRMLRKYLAPVFENSTKILQKLFSHVQRFIFKKTSES